MSLSEAGTWASIVGLPLSFVGFLVTIFMAWRSKTAAEQARVAARDARDSVRTVASISDLSTLISLLRTVKDLHRDEQWRRLLDKYDDIAQGIIQVRNASADIRPESARKLSSVIVHIRAIEREVERIVHDSPGRVDVPKLNLVVNNVLDNLIDILEGLKVVAAR